MIWDMFTLAPPPCWLPKPTGLVLYLRMVEVGEILKAREVKAKSSMGGDVTLEISRGAGMTDFVGESFATVTKA